MTKSTPIINDHELQTVIGRGSYGEVWLARNVMGVGRAVKVVERATFADARPYEREFSAIQRYEPVSRAADGLVNVLHVARDADDAYFYYVMELADADPTAADYAPRTLRSDLRMAGSLPVSECVRIALALAQALGALHRAGLVHRDIKPSNIIFVNGAAKLADIGLVIEQGESRSFVGTPGYIPPEGPGTTKADIFSLGRVLYEMCTGLDREKCPQLPREWIGGGAGDAMEFFEVVMRACEPDAALRYTSAEEMLADLALLASGQSVRRVRGLERKVRWLRRAGAVGTLLGIVIVPAWLWAQSQAHIEQENARRENALRLRAESAERTATSQYSSALLARAAAERRSGRAGARADALVALTEAARLHPGSAEVRDEMISALALTDFTESRSWQAGRTATTPGVFSADHARVALLTADGGVRVLSTTDESELAVLHSAVGSRGLVDFSPDGARLAVALEDGSLCVWDVAKKHAILQTPAGRKGQAFFSPDGARLIELRSSGRVVLHDLATGTANNLALGFLTGTAALRPDGAALAVEDIQHGRVVVLALADARVEREFALEPGVALYQLAWRPDGRWLAGASRDTNTYLWPLDPGGQPRVLAGHTAEVVCVAWDARGELLATSSWDTTTRLWDFATGRVLANRAGWGIWLHFAPDGSHLAQALSETERVILSALPPERPCRLLAEPWPLRGTYQTKGPWNVAFSPDGRLLISNSYAGARLYDTANGSEVAFLPTGNGVGLAARRDDLWIAAADSAGSDDQRGALWRWPWKISDEETIIGPPQKIADGQPVHWLAASADGVQLAWTLGNFGGPLFLSRASDPPQRVSSDTPRHIVALSSDGLRLATSQARVGGIQLWNTASAQPERTLATDGEAGIVFGLDGKWVATCDARTVRQWDAATGALLWRVEKNALHDSPPWIACSPGSTILAVTLDATRIALLDATTGATLARIAHPLELPICALAFSPDGSTLAAACPTHVIQLWDLRTLRSTLTPLGLDWPGAPFPKREAHSPLRVRVQ